MKVYINKEYSEQYTLELTEEEYRDLQSDSLLGQLEQLDKYEYEQRINSEKDIVNVEVYNND